MDALTLEEIWWRYPTFSQQPNTWMLKDISLQVRKGECFGITGHSGSGKTTLCRTILGILPTSARLTSEQLPHHFRGSVSILGQKISGSPINTKQIGMVLQDPETVGLPVEILRVSHEVEREQARELTARRQGRDQAAVDSALGAMLAAARSGANMIPAMLDAARAEGINTQLAALTAPARGFHSAEAFIAMAELTCGGLCPDLPER